MGGRAEGEEDQLSTCHGEAVLEARADAEASRAQVMALSEEISALRFEHEEREAGFQSERLTLVQELQHAQTEMGEWLASEAT